MILGEAQNILLQSRFAQFWQDLWGKVLILVYPIELERFWQDLWGKAKVLVNHAELEIVWRDFVGNP